MTSPDPRPLSIVRFKVEDRKKEIEQGYYTGLLDSDGKSKQFIYLGDMPNQTGHCVLIEIGPQPDLQGSFRLFHHTADFEEIPEDDL